MLSSRADADDVPQDAGALLSPACVPAASFDDSGLGGWGSDHELLNVAKSDSKIAMRVPPGHCRISGSKLAQMF
jgi:hypothetical protein